LYLYHVQPILDSLGEKGIRPLLWHDMMVEWDDEALRNLRDKADLVFWWYAGHPDEGHTHFHPKYRKRFHEQGITLWGASAYKGADGQSVDLPNIEARAKNNLGWVDVARKEKFKGVIATAWSRYSSHRVQCETYDGTLDSLLNVGVILHDGKEPAGGIDACRKALAKLPETKCFAACHAALKKLQDARNAAWKAVQEREELLWLEKAQPQRRGSEWSSYYDGYIRGHIQRVEEAGTDVRKVFQRLIPDVWLEEYLSERVEPIRRMYELLQKNRKK
jgi:hypothetical protein